MERPVPKQAIRPNIAAARLDYLHGMNGAYPNRTVPGLCKAHGLHVNTVRKYLPGWEAELEELVVSSKVTESVRSLRGGSLSVPSETLEISKEQTNFLLKRLEDIQSEIENLDKTVYKLENILEKFKDDDKEFLCKAFSSYLRFTANKQSLTKQYLAVHTRWTAVAGVDSVREIQVAGAKAVAVATARAGSNEEEKEETGEVVGFKRRN